jgi:hypothetical protein
MRLREFEEIEIARQSCRGDCEKGGKLVTLLSGFPPRIRPLYSYSTVFELLKLSLRDCPFTESLTVCFF